MKIFIDTNIFLDLILKRDAYKEATMILNSCDKKLFEGYVADITLLNIDYIASKQVKNIHEFLKIVINVFKIIGANNNIFDLALNIKNKDLEDNVQYVCATENDCDLIVSNDKNFYNGKLKIVSSREFVDKYI